MIENNFYNIAKQYVRLNMKVFPVKYRGKAPLIKTGFKGATTDLKQITEWSEKFSPCNIGLPTGEENGIFVVDIDEQEGFESLQLLEKEYGKLNAPAVLTGRGKHLYFKYPENITIRSSASKIAPHIDIRADGGYIVAPFSVHENGNQYHWENVNPNDLTFPEAPEWLLEIITGKNARINDISALLEDISNAPEGKRNDTLLRKSIRIQQLAKERSLNMANIYNKIIKSALQSGLEIEEVERTLENSISFSETLDNPDFQELDLSILKEKIIEPAPRMKTDCFQTMEEWVVETAASCNAAVDYVGFSLIAATGACMGLARSLSPWPGFVEYPCFFMGIVGDPSSRKTPTISPIKSILCDLEKSRKPEFERAYNVWKGENIAYEKKLKNWYKDIKKNPDKKQTIPDNLNKPPKPQSYRFCFCDTTQEALLQNLQNNTTGAIVFRDELYGWLAGMNRYTSGNAEKSFWLETYNGKYYSSDRVKFGEDRIEVPHLLISIFGTIQPKRVIDAFLGNAEDGLVPRFLWAYPEVVAPAIPKVAPNNEKVFRALKKLFNLVNPYGDNAENPKKQLKFSDEAQEMFNQWYLKHVHFAQAIEREDEKLGFFLNKGQGVVVRLSLMFEYLWWADSENPEPDFIGLNALNTAINFYEQYLFPMAKRVYGIYMAPEYQQEARKLAQYILNNKIESFTLRDIYYNAVVPGIRRKEQAEKATSILIKYGWLKTKKISRPGESRGRQKTLYIVNPEVFDSV
ncbi:MAG: DUF3987 domain-containing protein [Alphaproteobacteria bacterium]|nr:DUF3987 domain-containing protein [Alphaproteobacteria bacterium]